MNIADHSGLIRLTDVVNSPVLSNRLNYFLPKSFPKKPFFSAEGTASAAGCAAGAGSATGAGAASTTGSAAGAGVGAGAASFLEAPAPTIFFMESEILTFFCSARLTPARATA